MGFEYRKPRLPGSSKTPIWLLFFATHLFLYAAVVVAHMLLPQDMLKYYILAGALGFILLVNTALIHVVVGSRVASLGNMLQQDPLVIVGDPQCVSRLSRIPWYGVSEIDSLQLAILQTYNAYAIDSKAAGKQLAKVSSRQQQQRVYASMKKRWQQRRGGAAEELAINSPQSGPREDAAGTPSTDNNNYSPTQQPLMSGSAYDEGSSFHTADSYEYEPVGGGDLDSDDDKGAAGGGVGGQSRMKRMGYALGRKLRVVKDTPQQQQQGGDEGSSSVPQSGDEHQPHHQRDYYALAVGHSDTEKTSLTNNNNNKNTGRQSRIKQLFRRNKNKNQQQQVDYDDDNEYDAPSDVLYSCSSGGGDASSTGGGKKNSNTNNRKITVIRAKGIAGESPPLIPSSRSPDSQPQTYGSVGSNNSTTNNDSARASPQTMVSDDGIHTTNTDNSPHQQLLSPTVATLINESTTNVKEFDPLFDNASTWDVVQMGITDPGKSLLLQLLGQVKVGQGLSTVTLPVTILECRSLLERLSDMCVHWSYLLPIATGKITDDYQRMVAVFRWFIAAYRMKPAGARKPYNPILGEVFHCVVHNGDDPRYPHLRQQQQQQRGGSKRSHNTKKATSTTDNQYTQAELEGIDAIEFFAEQVSHHPPASAIYARHKDLIELKGIYHPHSKLVSLNCAASLAEGSFDVVFPKLASNSSTPNSSSSTNGGGRRYNVTWPSFFASGIVSGNPRMEIGGTVTITDTATNIHAKVEFLRKGWLSGEYDQMECVVLSPEGKNIQGKKYHGTWFGTIYQSDVNAKGGTVGPKQVFHDPIAAAPGAARPQAVPTSGHPKQSRGIWRELTRCLRDENQAGASDAKHLVESTQRQERKEMAAAGKEAVPAFFKFRGEIASGHEKTSTTSEGDESEAAVKAFKHASDTEKYNVRAWEFVGTSALLLK